MIAQMLPIERKRRALDFEGTRVGRLILSASEVEAVLSARVQTKKSV